MCHIRHTEACSGMATLAVSDLLTEDAFGHQDLDRPVQGVLQPHPPGLVSPSEGYHRVRFRRKRLIARAACVPIAF